MDHTGIAVIESTWWQEKNTSVRGLFELVADISCENPHAYRYEMANSEHALKETITRIATYKPCRYLYLAMHGDEKELQLINDEGLKRSELRNLLCKIRDARGSSLSGIYLGSCSFGTRKLAKFIFEADVGINWIAGYSEQIDWIKSSALDLLFFNELVATDEDETEPKRIKAAASELVKIAPGLIRNLGFGIYTRKQGGDVKNLLDAAHEQEVPEE